MSPEEETVHLYVESGPEKGRQITIPDGGARIGREEEGNDVVLNDPGLSRFHCRVFFDAEGRLTVADLGSTNDTLLNHKPVRESALHTGDRIEIGETVLLVINELRDDAVPAAAPTAPPPRRDVDLGLDATPAPAGRKGIPAFAKAAVILLLIVLVAALLKLLTTPAPSPVDEAAQLPTLELRYEKVEGSKENIFRYALQLEEGILSVRIDNLEDGRHLSRDVALDETRAANLARAIEGAGFLALQESYQGLATDVWDVWDLSVTINAGTHRVSVQNRVEPDAFKRTRELIEEFAQNELGLAALALAPEKLVEKAEEAVLLGKKLFDERQIQHGNLARAIRAFEEAQWYLETIEPKPDSYETAIAGLEESRRTLHDAYEDHLFRAERAIKLREWAEAADHLRVIIELIPDRTDERHEKAKKKLIDVERRLRR